jgi:hypothetical protein
MPMKKFAIFPRKHLPSSQDNYSFFISAGRGDYLKIAAPLKAGSGERRERKKRCSGRNTGSRNEDRGIKKGKNVTGNWLFVTRCSGRVPVESKGAGCWGGLITVNGVRLRYLSILRRVLRIKIASPIEAGNREHGEGEKTL